VLVTLAAAKPMRSEGVFASHAAARTSSRAGLSAWLRRHRRWLVILPPLAFLTVFFLVPFAFSLKISLAHTAVHVPPYTDLVTVSRDHGLELAATAENYRYLWNDELYVVSYLYSLRTAFISTLICLMLGYPMAYAIARAPRRVQNMLLMVIILPFWTSFLLRVYALEGIIRENGILNTVLLRLGLIDQPLQMMYTSGAVYLGIVYTYLPFMVLPLFATLEKLDRSLLEAAADLGSPAWRAFLDITLPLSIPGVIAGSMLVFIPAIGEFVIPSLLGGPDSLMIGRVLWDEFFSNRNWPVASAVSVALLVLLVGPIALYQHYSTRDAEA
jgi:putrescine transport system permease protein